MLSRLLLLYSAYYTAQHYLTLITNKSVLDILILIYQYFILTRVGAAIFSPFGSLYYMHRITPYIIVAKPGHGMESEA